MSQDKLDNRIKGIFESMDHNDQEEALNRKEKVWQAVRPKEDKKNSKRWLLILFLGLLHFAAGWFLRNAIVNNSELLKVEQPDNIRAIKSGQLEIAMMKKELEFKSQQYDSLYNVNKNIDAKLAKLKDFQNSVSTPEKRFSTIYVRDTFYITEVKVEQQIVEKIIIDTILIEVPIVNEAPIAMIEENEADLKNDISGDLTTEISKAATSIQFNFTESKPIDK